jgi:hypothetical protein
MQGSDESRYIVDNVGSLFELEYAKYVLNFVKTRFPEI